YRASFEVRRGDAVVELGEQVEHLLAPAGRLRTQLVRHRPLLDVRPERLRIEDERAVAHEIDDALKGRAGAEGDLDGDGVGVEPLADLMDDRREISPDPVHLVDESEPRHAVLIRLAP